MIQKMRTTNVHIHGTRVFIPIYGSCVFSWIVRGTEDT